MRKVTQAIYMKITWVNSQVSQLTIFDIKDTLKRSVIQRYLLTSPVKVAFIAKNSTRQQ